jgi:hypothetical protein
MHPMRATKRSSLSDSPDTGRQPGATNCLAVAHAPRGDGGGGGGGVGGGGVQVVSICDQ